MRFNIPIYCILLICVFNACAPELYYPTMQNILAFKEKGEFRGSAAFTDFGYDIQSAYAVSNHVGVMAHYMQYKNDAVDNNYKTPSFGSGYEVGAGYFTTKKNLIFETYGFVGKGKVENGQGLLNGIFFQPYGKLSANMHRLALQQSVTYSKKYFEVALSTRLSHVRYGNISNEPYEFNQVDVAEFLRNNKNYTFLEPALTLRFGLKNAKIYFQMQRSILLNKVSNINYDYYQSPVFLGITFKI